MIFIEVLKLILTDPLTFIAGPDSKRGMRWRAKRIEQQKRKGR